MSNPIREKSYQLALQVVRICTGPQRRKLGLLKRQLFDAATSCGANIEEAQAAEGRKDFVHKIGIATKEAHETGYWLRLARDAELLPMEILAAPLGLTDEVIRLGHAIIGTTRARLASGA